MGAVRLLVEAFGVARDPSNRAYVRLGIVLGTIWILFIVFNAARNRDMEGGARKGEPLIRTYSLATPEVELYVASPMHKADRYPPL